jgi:hypothetical protein
MLAERIVEGRKSLFFAKMWRAKAATSNNNNAQHKFSETEIQSVSTLNPS